MLDRVMVVLCSNTDITISFSSWLPISRKSALSRLILSEDVIYLLPLLTAALCILIKHMKCLVFFSHAFERYYFQDLFDLSNKQTSKTDMLLGEIRSSDDGKITHVCKWV